MSWYLHTQQIGPRLILTKHWINLLITWSCIFKARTCSMSVIKSKVTKYTFGTFGMMMGALHDFVTQVAMHCKSWSLWEWRKSCLHEINFYSSFYSSASHSCTPFGEYDVDCARSMHNVVSTYTISSLELYQSRLCCNAIEYWIVNCISLKVIQICDKTPAVQGMQLMDATSLVNSGSYSNILKVCYMTVHLLLLSMISI